MLDVLSVHEVFPQVKLKVDASSDSIAAVEYKYPGAKKTLIEHPIALTALAPVNYFQQHPPFSVMGFIFGNPMMLMMIFSFAVIIFFPMLTQGLNEDQLKVRHFALFAAILVLI